MALRLLRACQGSVALYSSDAGSGPFGCTCRFSMSICVRNAVCFAIIKSYEYIVTHHKDIECRYMLEEDLNYGNDIMVFVSLRQMVLALNKFGSLLFEVVIFLKIWN